MKNNQWRKELTFGVPNAHISTIVPQQENDLPARPMTYSHNESPMLDVQLFGSFTPSAALGYRQGTYVPETGLIYCYSYGSNLPIIAIDPIKLTVTTIGSNYSLSTWGQIRSPYNGCIYGMPYSTVTQQVLKFDPTTNVMTSVGANIGSVSLKYIGGVLAPNGCIYGIPYSATQVLKIDPTTDTVTLFGSLSGAAGKWAGGVLAPNGKIYCVPFGINQVMVIDTNNGDAISFFGNIDNNATGRTTIANLWLGASLGLDGKIYCFPYTAQTVLVIDPETNTLQTYAFNKQTGSNGGYTTANLWASSGFSLESQSPIANYAPGTCMGVMGTNGKFYAGQLSNSDTKRCYVYEIDPLTKQTTLIQGSSSLTSFSQPTAGAPFGGSVLCPDGSIIILPSGATQYMRISGFAPATPDMYTMPTNLGNLSTSAYNRHCNKL